MADISAMPVEVHTFSMPEINFSKSVLINGEQLHDSDSSRFIISVPINPDEPVTIIFFDELIKMFLFHNKLNTEIVNLTIAVNWPLFIPGDSFIFFVQIKKNCYRCA